MMYGEDGTEGMGTAAESMTDPFHGIEGRIAKELQHMHYELPADDAMLMAERAYALSEEHIFDRITSILQVVPDASLRGVAELWGLLNER